MKWLASCVTECIVVVAAFQIHFVHYDSVYESASAAANQTEGLAVIAVFVEVSAAYINVL